MFEKWYPDERCDTAYEIDYAGWRKRGKKALLFDVDNTLVRHGAAADMRSRELFRKLRELGYGTCIISNNKEPRVRSFAQSVGSKYVFKANKPSPEGYIKGCRLLGALPSETLFIGDQIFTDIWGARRAGIYSILVKPIHPLEEIQIILKRRLEWFVLRAYEKDMQKLKTNGK